METLSTVAPPPDSPNPSATIPAVTRRTPIHSSAERRWRRNRSEKKARTTKPDPWIERATETGVKVSAAAKSPHPAAEAARPATQRLERRTVRIVRGSSRPTPIDGISETASFCSTIPMSQRRAQRVISTTDSRMDRLHSPCGVWHDCEAPSRIHMSAKVCYSMGRVRGQPCGTPLR